MSEDELLAESLLEYLKSKKRDCMAEKLEILSRYGVSSASELEAVIGEGTVAEHPSWEDLIVIENLEEKIKRLDKEIGNIESLSGNSYHGERRHVDGKIYRYDNAPAFSRWR